MTNEIKEVPQITKRQCDLVVAMLNKLDGARYRIVLPDGTVYHKDMEEAPPSSGIRRNIVHSRGELQPYYESEVRGMEVGAVVTVTPPPNCDLETMRGCMTSLAVRLWGKGNHISTINRESNTVEILRTGGN